MCDSNDAIYFTWWNFVINRIPVANSGITSIPVCAAKKPTVSKIAAPSSGHFGKLVIF